MKKILNERKRLLNEGPGAGYSITLSENLNFTIKNKTVNGTDIELELEVPNEYKRDFDALNAEGYDWDTQYGRQEYMCETPLKAVSVFIDGNLLYDECNYDYEYYYIDNEGFEGVEYDYENMDKEQRIAFIAERLFSAGSDFYITKGEFGYGGGWSHSSIGNPVEVPIGISVEDVIDDYFYAFVTNDDNSIGQIEFDFDYGSFDGLVEDASDYYEAYRERYAQISEITYGDGNFGEYDDRVYFYDLGLDNDEEDDSKIKAALIEYLKDDTGEDITDVDYEVMLSESNKRKGRMIKENKKVKKNLKESRRANDGLVETLQLTSDFIEHNYDEVEEMLDSIKWIDISKVAKNFYDFFTNEDYGTAWEMLDSRLAIVVGKDEIPENYVPNEDDDFFPYQIALKDMRHDDMPDYDWLDQPLYNEDDVYETEMIYKECPSLNEIERSVSWIIGEYGEYIEKLKELYDDFYEEQWGPDEEDDEEEEDLDEGCNNRTKLRESIRRKFKQRMIESRKKTIKESYEDIKEQTIKITPEMKEKYPSLKKYKNILIAGEDMDWFDACEYAADNMAKIPDILELEAIWEIVGKVGSGVAWARNISGDPDYAVVMNYRNIWGNRNQHRADISVICVK